MFAIRNVVVLYFVLYITKSVDAQCKREINNEYKVICERVEVISQEVLNETVESATDLVIKNDDLKMFRLSANAFKNMKNLKYIIIGGYTHTIFSKTFEDMPNLYGVRLFGTINDIEESAFFNLPHLHYITIDDSNLSVLRRGVFRNVPKLTSILIGGSQLIAIENNPFYDVPNLTELEFVRSPLKSFTADETLSFPQKLLGLNLSRNLLTTVTNMTINNLTNLRVLVLFFNDISVIEPNSFEQTPNLQYLDLRSNQLREIDGNIFPRSGMALLKQIDIRDNHLMYLSSKFFIRLQALEKIEIRGNPWFCPCLKQMYEVLSENEIAEPEIPRYDVERNTKLPVCVSSNNEDKNICGHFYNEELSNKYLSYVKKYNLRYPYNDHYIAAVNYPYF